MKRKNLTAAVLAGLAGAAGIAGSAQAVNLNPDGLGQVLIYPYYTTRGGNDTLLSVVNTTENGKAVKVRFLESRNSREVLDFNLYMSPFDVWVAAITDIAGEPNLIVPDTSCTVPYWWGDFPNAQGNGQQMFLNFAYSGDDNDGGPESLSRAAEGHFEMIEMGTMTDVDFGSESAAEHIDSGGIRVPRDCQQLVDAWSIIANVPGYWLVDRFYDMTTPSGGMFGSAAIINPTEGAMYSYDAKAINGFTTQVSHTDPGDELPSLAGGDISDAFVFFDDGSLVTASYSEPVEAVSAVFMHDQLMNEYNIASNIGANSEWVVTFPTKRFYIDPAFAIDTVPVDPFTEALSEVGDACENFQMEFWDREEDNLIVTTDQEPLPSPRPPVIVDIVLFELCFETNVIRFGEAPEDPVPTEILGSETAVSFDVTIAGSNFEDGWARMNLRDYDSSEPLDGIFDSIRVDRFGLVGLPVTGFWVERFINANAEPGKIANYGGIFQHKATRALITVN